MDDVNLKVFEFDYDLTFCVFFLSPDERVYARYGERTPDDADELQSLAGLRYTMESVLAEHSSSAKRFAPQRAGKSFSIVDIASPRALGQGCFHCHQAKEILNDRLVEEGKWTVDSAFRYPPPDNLGFKLEVDRGNVVSQVEADSPADCAGLRVGDMIRTLSGVPIHSIGDAHFALDRAPTRGVIEVEWQRAARDMRGRIELPEQWRRTDISWRASLWKFIVAPRVYGKDLTADEKQALGLSANQLAFRQKDNVSETARKAGIRAGDIIIGVNGQTFELTAYKFSVYVRSRYVKGDTINIMLIRDGRRMTIPMQLE